MGRNEWQNIAEKIPRDEQRSENTVATKETDGRSEGQDDAMEVLKGIALCPAGRRDMDSYKRSGTKSCTHAMT